MIMTRRRAHRVLFDDLVLQIDPRKVDWYASPPLDALHIKTKALHSHKLGRVLSMIIRAPYELLVYPGNWDLHGHHFTEHRTYTKMLDLYQHRDNFRESKLYQHALEVLQEQGSFNHKSHVAHTVEELDELFEKVYMELIRSMEQHGYIRERSADLCRVMISRDGKLMKTQRGKHRFSTAHIVGAPVVPVLVFRIHRKWLKQVDGGFRGRKLDNLRAALRELESRYS
ncbi:MAG: hypothetical protein EA428_00490 [Spirochaetaceae bacterium]|nr:MAG: hypothetical protein EA428_00490 [Spirochaetaceae bacterium]